MQVFTGAGWYSRHRGRSNTTNASHRKCIWSERPCDLPVGTVCERKKTVSFSADRSHRFRYR